VHPRSSLTLRLVPILLAAPFSLGCEGMIGYRGTVVEAPTAGYAFTAEPNPEHLPPIASANVTFCVCKGMCACDGSPADAPRVRTTKSQVADAQGRFELDQFVANDIVHGDQYVVRASAPGFEPFAYARTERATAESEPITGVKQLTLRLQRARATAILSPEPAPRWLAALGPELVAAGREDALGEALRWHPWLAPRAAPLP
jgi:hypothetical protein